MGLHREAAQVEVEKPEKEVKLEVPVHVLPCIPLVCHPHSQESLCLYHQGQVKRCQEYVMTYLKNLLLKSMNIASRAIPPVQLSALLELRNETNPHTSKGAERHTQRPRPCLNMHSELPLKSKFAQVLDLKGRRPQCKD